MMQPIHRGTDELAESVLLTAVADSAAQFQISLFFYRPQWFRMHTMTTASTIYIQILLIDR